MSVADTVSPDNASRNAARTAGRMPCKIITHAVKKSTAGFSCFAVMGPYACVTAAQDNQSEES